MAYINRQVIRKCEQCGNCYFVDFTDDIPLCHDCYFELEKAYKKYKREFKKTHDKGCEPVCMREFYDNEYQELMNEV